jgi:hypothetical protein
LLVLLSNFEVSNKRLLIEVVKVVKIIIKLLLGSVYIFPYFYLYLRGLATTKANLLLTKDTK